MTPKVTDEGAVVVNKIIKQKSNLKATPEVRKAFDELVSEESFLSSSETILKYVTSCLLESEESEEDLPEDVQYVFKRLIKGLASKRKFARQGCYTTLQALLQLHTKTFPFATHFVEEFFNQNHEQEKLSDYKMGHILAYGAIVRSGFAMTNPTLMKNIIDKLVASIGSTSSLDIVAGQFLVNFLVMYREKGIIPILWTELHERIQTKIAALEPSLLWLRFIFSRSEFVKDLSPIAEDFQEQLNDASYAFLTFTLRDLFKKNVNILVMMEDIFKSIVLREGPDGLVALFSKQMIPSAKKGTQRDIGFILDAASVAIPHLVTSGQIETILTPEVVGLLVSTKGSEDGKTSARRLMSAILQVVISSKEKKGDNIQLCLVKLLISTNASLRFDRVTDTTMLEQVISHLDVRSIKGFSEFIFNSIEQQKKFKNLKQSLPYALVLSELSYHPQMAGSDHLQWKASQVAMLLKFTFFRKQSKEEQKKLKDFYLKALNQNTTNLEHQVALVDSVVERTAALMEGQSASQCSLAQAHKDEFLRISATMNKLRNSKDVKSIKDRMVFRLLYGHMNLHLFLSPKSAMELLAEVDQCCEKALRANRDSGTGEPGWVEVVVDFLLGILSKDENIWRNVVVSIFRYICHLMEPSSVFLVTDVIHPDKEADILCVEGAEEEEEEEEEGEGDEDEEEDGVEEEKGDEDEDEDEDDDDEEDDEDDDDEDDDEEEDEEDGDLGDKEKEELLKLRMQMQLLAGLPENDVDMDTVPAEELESLDKSLGSLVGKFVALKNKKKREQRKSVKDMATLTHFRARTCDLLDILVKEAPSLAHLLSLVTPLLTSIRATSAKARKNLTQEQFLKRLKTVAMELEKVKKFSSPCDVTSEQLLQEVQTLFEFSSEAPKAMSRDVEACFTFLLNSANNMENKDPKCVKNMFRIYAERVEHCLTRGIPVTGSPLNIKSKQLSVVVDKLVPIVYKASYKKQAKLPALTLLQRCTSIQVAVEALSKVFVKKVFSTVLENTVKLLNGITNEKKMDRIVVSGILTLLKNIKNLEKNNPSLGLDLDWAPLSESLSSFWDRLDWAKNKVLKKAVLGVAFVLQVTLKMSDPDKVKETREEKKLRKEKKKNKKNRKKGAKKEEKKEEEEVEGEVEEVQNGEGEELKTKGKKSKKQKTEISDETLTETKTKKTKKQKKEVEEEEEPEIKPKKKRKKEAEEEEELDSNPTKKLNSKKQNPENKAEVKPKKKRKQEQDEEVDEANPSKKQKSKKQQQEEELKPETKADDPEDPEDPEASELSIKEQIKQRRQEKKERRSASKEKAKAAKERAKNNDEVPAKKSGKKLKQKQRKKKRMLQERLHKIQLRADLEGEHEKLGFAQYVSADISLDENGYESADS